MVQLSISWAAKNQMVSVRQSVLPQMNLHQHEVVNLGKFNL